MASSAGPLDFESPTGRQPVKHLDAHHGASPTSEDGVVDKDYKEDCRFFRSFKTQPQLGSGSAASPEQTNKSSKADAKLQPPPIRFPVENGDPLPGVHCKSCGSDLVLCQNCSTGHQFFGCVKFGKTNCRFTMDYNDGMAAVSRAASLR